MNRADVLRHRYATEELLAELASAHPADIAQRASYINNWLGTPKIDKREIFSCASEAQKIVDMGLRFHPEVRTQQEPERPVQTTSASVMLASERTLIITPAPLLNSASVPREPIDPVHRDKRETHLSMP